MPNGSGFLPDTSCGHLEPRLPLEPPKPSQNRYRETGEARIFSQGKGPPFVSSSPCPGPRCFTLQCRSDRHFSDAKCHRLKPRLFLECRKPPLNRRYETGEARFISQTNRPPFASGALPPETELKRRTDRDSCRTRAAAD